MQNQLNRIKVINILRKNKMIKLNLGCGNDIKTGWINIDSGEHFGEKNLDIIVDLSQGIPFPENSVDYIFNEHFIEHLTREEGILFLQEAFRVLKTNGIIRIACPDLDLIINDYLTDSFKTREWLNKIAVAYKGKSNCELLNISMRDWGHKYIYNKDELIQCLKLAGFDERTITPQQFKESERKELKNLETREDSLILEAVKCSDSRVVGIPNSENKIFTNKFSLKKQEHYNFIIIDDYFPNPHANTWRAEEFHEYLKNIPNMKIFRIPESFHNKFMRGLPDKNYHDHLASYLKYRPENNCFISRIDPDKQYTSNLAYLLFFNNISLMLPWLEKNKIPFVFCLYPGGGFFPESTRVRLELKNIFSSAMFKEVIVTQNYTKNYLLENNLCCADKINFIYGGFSQLDPNKIVKKKLCGKDKNTFDICFVAHKYSIHGVKKGFDIFIEVAEKLSKQFGDIHFHIVGNWEKEMKTHQENPNIHFYPIQPIDFFYEFYSHMDILLSPNRSFKSLKYRKEYLPYADNIEFDGFPLGIDAGYCGVALFVTDELENAQGFFGNERDIVLIDHDVDNICTKITNYYNNKKELYLLSEQQRDKIKFYFNTNTQILPRLRIIKKYIDKV